MEMHELLRRAEDLARRSEQRNCLTKSGFLTPAERYALQHHPALRGSRLVFSGGYPEAERRVAAFHAEGAFLESFPTFNLVIYTIPDIISVTLLIMFIAFLAGTLPARRAAHKNPIDSLRYE